MMVDPEAIVNKDLEVEKEEIIEDDTVDIESEKIEIPTYYRIISKNVDFNPILTKYERTKLLSSRIIQLNSGNPPLVDITGLKSTYEIALKELNERKIPLLVKKIMPDGSYREFDISELIF